MSMADDSADMKSAGLCSPRSTPSSSGGGGGGSKEAVSQSPKRVWRIKLTEQQIESLSKEELMAKWREQDAYIDFVESQANILDADLVSARESEAKYRQQYGEASHREKILVRRLTSKEIELQDYLSQLNQLKNDKMPTTASLRSTLVDPAVNLLIQKLRQELLTTKSKLEDTQNELSAWKFTPDSNTGKRLMAKCRLLLQENEELGKMISSGRIAKLEGELALQKTYSDECKKSQEELDEFLQELDEDLEGMQSTIYFLQQELKKAHNHVILLQQENAALKAGGAEIAGSLPNGLSPHTPPSLTQIKKEDSDDTKATLDIAEATSEQSLVESSPQPLIISEPYDGACEKVMVMQDLDRQLELESCEQNDHNDEESSSDSAALIIKVENEYLVSEEREVVEGEDDCDNEGDNDSGQQGMVHPRTKRTLKTRGSAISAFGMGGIGGIGGDVGGVKSNGKIVRDDVIMRTTRGSRDKAKREKTVTASSGDEERIVFKKKRKDLYTNADRMSIKVEDDKTMIPVGSNSNEIAMMQSDPE